MQENSKNLANTPFSALSPDRVLEAAESLGLDPDGRLFALNSYENRVYQLGSHTHGALVIKFYRALRWSDAAIREEHAFAAELRAADLPVAAPLGFAGETLIVDKELRYSVFPRESARPIELDTAGSRELLGRTLGRMHAIGAIGGFKHRPALSIDRYGWQARQAILSSPHLAAFGIEDALIGRYAEVSDVLLRTIEVRWQEALPLALIRIHGDCHLGNLLSNEHGPVIVDLDDTMRGPRVQDLWMLLSGSADDQSRQWDELMQGYRRFHHIDERERALIEPLRALRMIHHVAWVVTRWTDPAFPRAFPSVSSSRFWQEYISDLWQQVEVVR